MSILDDRDFQKSLAVALIAVTLGGFLFWGINTNWWGMYAVEEVEEEYTTDLITAFTVMDDTSDSMLTSNISPQFYSTAVDPMAYTFTGSAIVSGTYDSTDGRWEAVLDKGSYQLLIKDTAGSKTKYPLLTTASVPGTSSETRTVHLSPYMPKMVQRASPSLSASLLAYNVSSGAYDISAANVNYTKYDKWRVHLQITVAGQYKTLKAGRLYLTDINGLSYTSAQIATTVSVYQDTDASDDGMTGYYIQIPEIAGGTVEDVYIYLWDTAMSSTGTITFTMHDYYACKLPSLRYWSDSTTTLSIVS